MFLCGTSSGLKQVQRRLQLRIEAQGKYLQSVLEKAQDALGKQNLGSAGLEAARVQLSELVSKVSSECLSTELFDTKGTPRSQIHHACTIQLTDHTMDRCLTSYEESQKNRDINNTSRRLITYHGSSSQCAGQTSENMELQHAQLSSNEFGMHPSSIFPVQKNSSLLPANSRNQRLTDGNSTDSERWENDGDKNYSYHEQPNSKRLALQHEKVKKLNADEQKYSKAYLDLNIHDDDGSAPGCKQFDLNHFNWN